MSDNPSNAMATAIEVVTSKVDELNNTAERYSSVLQDSLAALGNIKMNDVAQPQIAAVPEAPVPVFNLGEVPEFTPGTLLVPNDPSAPAIDYLLGQLDVGDMDAIPDAPEMPALNLPSAPGMAHVPVPLRPGIDTQVDIPDAPVVVLPEMEALQAITLPEFEFPQLPDFDEQAPDASAIVVPNVFINWAEPQYESELLGELETLVRSWMLGGTGLPPAIEDALFARARERDSGETARAVQEAVDTWAARDFSMPPGMLAKQANAIREQGRLKAAELNRDILTEAAKWEIENIRFAVQQGLALEQLTENLFNNTVTRLFEVAKFQAESQINVFNAQIGLFNAQNAAFQTLAQVYRTKLDGALAKLQAYKTAIDGQVALGQINQQRVEVYKAKLTGVQASVEVFNAMMRGAQVRAEVIKNQFDAYRVDVQAFAEQIGAEKVKFDAHKVQAEGEAIKAGVYETRTKAYAATVQAVASKADIKAKGAQLRLDAARVRISEYQASQEMFRAKLQASLSQLQYDTQAFGARVDAYRAKASANTAAAEVQSRFADMQTRTNIAFSEMQLSQYTANVNKAHQQAMIALEAAKAMGGFAAQLAAGAMSALHVSAGVSGTGSQNDTWGTSTTRATNTNHNYSY